MPTLTELKDKFTAKQTEVAGLFEKAKIEKDGEVQYDFSRVKELGDGSTAEKLEKLGKMQDELNSLFDECKAQADAEEKFNQDRKLDREPAPDRKMIHPDGDGAKERKTLGQMIAGHPTYKSFIGGGLQGKGSINFSIPDYGLAEIKTLFETAAGWAPESVRIPGFTEGRTRPIQFLDIIPTGQTGMSSVVYMEETTRTHSAAEKAEGAAFAESTFAFTEQTQAVRKITDSVPVTDEQLEDVAQAESYLGERVRFGLRQRLDSQVLVGDDIAPNLLGINNFTGIQTQAKGGDPTPDAIHKAMTLVRVTGRAMPTHVILHPNDWEAIRLLRTIEGIYIWGNPADLGADRIWGLPVVQTDAQTENTGIVGSFLAPHITLFERRGVNVEIGYTGTQFVEGKRTIRADLRAALVGFRPTAFATVTGI